jgi:hypothetical protein
VSSSTYSCQARGLRPIGRIPSRRDVPAVTRLAKGTNAAPIALAEVVDALSEAEPPTPPQRARLIERLQPWVEVFSKLATAAVLVLAFAQYYSAGQDQKRERALNLVDQWTEGGYSDRLAAISSHFQTKWSAAQKEIDALPVRDAELLKRAKANAEHNIFQELAEPSDAESVAVRKDIDLLLRFFAQAEICVSAQLCDAGVAGSYFLVEARSIQTELDPLFTIMRESVAPTYGKALDDFIALVGPGR